MEAQAMQKEDWTLRNWTQDRTEATASHLRSTVSGSPTTAASPETKSGAAGGAGNQRVPSRRRSRYVRDPKPVVLTPASLRLLETVATYRLVSLPQLVRLSDLSAKATQRAMRTLFDAGLVEIVAASRAALAEPGDPNDASLLFGSAPNIYSSSRTGIRLLDTHGLAEGLVPTPLYGPKNALLLRHELGVRDTRIFLELAARRHPGQAVKAWHDGPEAALDLRRDQAPKTVRPDAWFVYRLGQQERRELVLVGLVEYDRATERGERRWAEKLAAYRHLFSGPRLRDALGYDQARILVVCPTVTRRETLADMVARHAEPALGQRFWLTTQAALERPNLSVPIWQRPGNPMLHPLLATTLLNPAL